MTWQAQSQRPSAHCRRALGLFGDRSGGARGADRLLHLLGSDAGAVISGELLSALPPSVLGVLEADRNGGSFNPLQSATLGEWELPIEQAVSGSRTLAISVSPN